MADFFASAFWTGFLWPLIIMIAESVLVLVVLLVAIAYILLADRKIWAAVQIRRGPNVVGPWGLLQSFADLLKFVLKEPIIPSGSNKGVFLLAPLVSCVLALAAWAVIPMDLGWVISDINVGVLYIFAISSLSIYGIIMGGLKDRIPYTYAVMVIGTLALTGFPLTAGYFSKDAIIESAFVSHNPFAFYGFLMTVVAAGLTSFYSWRLIFKTFHGEPHGRGRAVRM